MKTLQDYIAETEEWMDDPQVGDAFDIELAPDHLIETVILETTADGIVIEADEHLERLLESRGWIGERIGTYGAVGYGGMGQTFFEKDQVSEHGGGIGPKQHWQSMMDEQGVAEASGQQLSVQQLATISDEALDKAYGYGRSTPGNSFGWQANLMSAAYAKKMIDAGVTDIEKISDAIHKGWNVTAQKFVQNPDQFGDTEKLRQAGKLEAKLQQRAQLMKQNYAQLPDDEQEKDRVVARALLQAIKGQKGVAEGMLDNIKQAWARLIAGLADKAIALDRTGELAGSQQRAIQHSTRELEQKLLAKIAGHPREDELRRHVDYIVAQAGQQTNFLDLAKTLHKMLDQFKPELEKFSESISDIDVELQDYKSMSPQEFERAYGMKKADWAMKHHDIIGKENLQVDWTGKTGFDYVKETSAYMARMLELAGVADHKYDKQDDVYHEDQAADIVARKEMDIDAARDLGEESACNMTAEGESCPVHGLEECGSIEEAKYQGREVKLGKPFLTPGGPKKRSVYVKNPKGNVVKVNFGDPNMRIKKSNPARRKSFRSRHNCANPGPRHKARFWSCRAW